MKVEDIGEKQLIRRIAGGIRPLDPAVAAGIGDDAAAIKMENGRFLLVAMDMLLEDVHFTRKMTFPQIGRKALAVNLSDIAAMGGEPKYCFVSLGLPRGTKAADLGRIYRGLKGMAADYGVDILGGDTNLSASGIVIDVCLIGEAGKDSLCLRSGARPGEAVMVTGRLGKSALQLSRGGYAEPAPRVREAKAIIEICAPTSMIDLSDGLAADLNSLCESSRCGAVIYSEKIPAARNATAEMSLCGGEDFELLFTVRPERAERLLSLFEKRTGVPLTCIGEMTEGGRGVQIADSRGNSRKLEGGYEHF